jgi:ribosomal protein S18 acetylase RimI-like enzyme
MEIRQATKNDVDDLAELCMGVQEVHIEMYPLLFRRPSHQELTAFFNDRLSGPDYTTYLAIADGKPIGYVFLHIIRMPANIFVNSREAIEIDHIHVLPSYRRQGIGRQLAAKANEVATSLRIDQVQLNVWAQNNRAIAAFKSFGFEPQRHVMFLKIN